MDTELKRKVTIDVIELVNTLEDFDKGRIQLSQESITVKQALLSATLSRMNFFVSEQADRVSRRLLLLTWALLAFTFVLLVLTAYLAYDSYTAHHNGKLPDQSAPK